MDGHFVPNLTFGPPIIKALRPLSQKIFDVHLMVQPVEHLIDAFIDAGADIITVHQEAVRDLRSTLSAIRARGVRAGVSIKPATPIDCLDPYYDVMDLVLIMTVEPGFGGQSFMPDMLPKIRHARARINESNRSVDLEIDGGITPETAPLCRAAGANVLVAGTSVFRGGEACYAQNIAALRNAPLMTTS
jgi:ribulose-phosphate 3-epimerase